MHSLPIIWAPVPSIRFNKISAQGKNPNSWVNMYSYLQRNKAHNGRYRQAVQYVTRIRSYLEHIKTTQLVNI